MNGTIVVLPGFILKMSLNDIAESDLKCFLRYQDYIWKSTSDSKSYMIFVDSEAAQRAIESVWCKSRLIHECKESLRTFGSDRIHLCWDSSHSEILGNETVDAFARLDSLSDDDLVVGPDSPIRLLYGLIKCV